MKQQASAVFASGSYERDKSYARSLGIFGCLVRDVAAYLMDFCL